MEHYYDSQKAEALNLHHLTFMNGSEYNIDWLLNTQMLEASSYTLDVARSPKLSITQLSPVELRVYDTQGRVTGLVDGIVKTEIPYSIWRDGTVIIYLPNDNYTCQVVGIKEGVYGITTENVADSNTKKFEILNVPISSGVVHEFALNSNTMETTNKIPINIITPESSEGVTGNPTVYYLSISNESNTDFKTFMIIGIVLIALIAILGGFYIYNTLSKSKHSNRN